MRSTHEHRSAKHRRPRPGTTGDARRAHVAEVHARHEPDSGYVMRRPRPGGASPAIEVSTYYVDFGRLFLPVLLDR